MVHNEEGKKQWYRGKARSRITVNATRILGCPASAVAAAIFPIHSSPPCAFPYLSCTFDHLLSRLCSSSGLIYVLFRLCMRFSRSHVNVWIFDEHYRALGRRRWSNWVEQLCGLPQLLVLHSLEHSIATPFVVRLNSFGSSLCFCLNKHTHTHTFQWYSIQYSLWHQCYSLIKPNLL